ncbi:hypothetical protein [Nocardioides sp.]|uniref:hypothetical protein n=1 Tax=Nocardioides sp. TaxID=35761 RepID=UPI0035689C65
MSLATHARAGLVAVVLSLTPALVACSGDDAPDPVAVSTPATPLESFATESLTGVRGPFCEAIADTEVAELLDSPVTKATSYDNGERARVVDGTKDVAHEFSCTWRTEDATVARAWVFAPPVTPARARDLARDLARAARTGEGCAKVKGAPAFGAPSVAVRCTEGRISTVSFHGLFGAAWLSCSVESRGPDVLDLAGRWCVLAAQAASE